MSGLALLATMAAAAPSAAAAAPRVETFVVGRSGILAAPRTVPARATTVRASGRRCAVAAGTPLAALAAFRRAGGPAFRVRDDGACSRRAIDSASLYVFQVGGDRARGRDGWVYKVGHRVGTAGAADQSGPFGTGRRLRGGQRVTWFWCVLTRRGACQRTLGIRVVDRAPLTVVVRSYDDTGRSRLEAGATVNAGGRTAVTDRRGRARIAVSGGVRVGARKAGLVPAPPKGVRAG